MEKEVWKPIIGYEGLYEVSTFGNVKSLNYNHTGKEKILRIIVKKGYGHSTLCRDGNRKTFKNHRLKAFSFIPNPLNLPQINHLDGNKLNNGYQENGEDNLQRATGSDNRKHSFRVLGEKPTKYRLGKFGKDNATSKKIIQYSLGLKVLKVWDSIADIERELGFFGSNISKCCKGKIPTAYGFLRQYAN